MAAPHPKELPGFSTSKCTGLVDVMAFSMPKLPAIELRPATTVVRQRVAIRDITHATRFDVLEVYGRCVEISEISNKATGGGRHRQLWWVWLADEGMAIQTSIWAPLGEPRGEFPDSAKSSQ